MNIATPERRFAPISIAETLRVALVLAVFGVLLWQLSDELLLGFTAVFLAVLLRAAAEGLHRFTRLPVGLALGALCIVGAGTVVGFGFIIGPRLVHESQELIGTIVGFAQNLRQQYSGTAVGHAVMQAVSGKSAIGIVPVVPRVLSLTFGTISGLLLLLVTALYLAGSPEPYMKGGLLLVPISYRARARAIMDEVTHVLRYWMLGQLIDMAVVGVLSAVGLTLLHVPLAFTLGILAGALTFIPYIGAILAAVPALIVASAVGPATILYVVLLYLLCHLVEGYIVAPIVMRRTVHLPPALTVLAMFTMGSLYGFTGVLVATPLAAVLIVLVREIYVRDMLGDTAQNPMVSRNRRILQLRRGGETKT